MAEFFASTAKGLGEPLEAELNALGFTKTRKIAGGVFFEGSWKDCYKANLQSRLASRILKPILDFTAYQPDELYNQIRKHDFTKYINPNQTIKVEAVVSEGMMHDQRFVAMKVKDAIVDQFREKFDVRPDVDTANPDLRIMIHGFKNNFHLAIDTSGDSLFMRGYRKEATEAPVKENLAAGLLTLTEWDRKSTIIDPMCGSGTFLIEAALMALNFSAGGLRRRFGFMNLLNFDKTAWEEVLDEAADLELQDLPFKLYGYDLDKSAIAAAKANARQAGVDHVIEFKAQGIINLNPPENEKGIIVTNPPYGIRLGDKHALKDTYKDLGFVLKHRFKGWDAWILSGNKDLILDMKLKTSRKFFVFNGNLECRFLKYSMF